MGGGERLRRLLASLDAGEARETLVVDNASADSTTADLPEEFPGVRVLAMERNVGFGKAVNAAARVARGEVLVLVNDDCVCAPGFVEALAGGIDLQTNVAMAAGVLLEAADHSAIDSAGIDVDRTLLAYDYMNGEPLSLVEEGVPDPIGPTGGAAAFDREVFLRLGGFDQALFAFWEDVDLALRMRLEGYRCALVPRAQATHEHSATLGSGSARKNYLMGFGRGYLLRKYGALSPRRMAGIALRDGVIVGGQLVIDRNLSGVRGRVAGWARGRRERGFPAELIEAFDPPSLGYTLRRRRARRARLRGAAADASANGFATGDGAPDPRPRRALAVFHVAEMSGPALSLQSRLRWLAEACELGVVVPGEGATAQLYREFAEVSTLPYEALTVPRSPISLARAAIRHRGQIAAFRAHFRELRPDLVVVATAMLPAAQIAARRERIPVAIEASELLTSGRGSVRRLAGRALTRRAATRAEVIFACSHAVAGQYAGFAGPVITSYPPIEPERGDGDGGAFRRRHGISPEAPLVLAAGSITERRGHDVLVEAMRIVRRRHPAICVIAGEPFPRSRDLDFEHRLRELAASEGDVKLVGYEPRMIDAYAAADVVVNPCRDPEAFGRVACEALVARRPVVATRVGAVPEVLRDGVTALLVPPGDREAMGSAITRLLGDGSLALRLAERGREDVIARFSDAAALARFRDGLSLIGPDRG